VHYAGTACIKGPDTRSPHEAPMQLAEAFKIAFDIHGNQRDRGGDPYLFHVVRVAMSMKTDEERAAALLHDTVEASATLEAQVDLVRKIRLHFGEAVSKTVLRLTRTEFEPYMDYIRRLSTDKLAVKVKLADLADNMREERLAKLPDVEADQLRAKYGPAYLFLGGDIRIEAFGAEKTLEERERAARESFEQGRKPFPEHCCAECHGPLDGAYLKHTPAHDAIVCSKCFSTNTAEMPPVQPRD